MYYHAAKLGRHEACTQFHMHSLILIFNKTAERAQSKKKHISVFGIHYLSECEPFRPELMQETQRHASKYRKKKQQRSIEFHMYRYNCDARQRPYRDECAMCVYRHMYCLLHTNS